MEALSVMKSRNSLSASSCVAIISHSLHESANDNTNREKEKKPTKFPRELRLFRKTSSESRNAAANLISKTQIYREKSLGKTNNQELKVHCHLLQVPNAG